MYVYERNLIATEQQKRFIENNFTASTDGSALNFVFLLLLFWRLNILDFFFFVTSHIYELLNATKVIQNFDSSRFRRCGACAASKFKYFFFFKLLSSVSSRQSPIIFSTCFVCVCVSLCVFLTFNSNIYWLCHYLRVCFLSPLLFTTHVSHYIISFCVWMMLLCSKRGTF